MTDTAQERERLEDLDDGRTDAQLADALEHMVEHPDLRLEGSLKLAARRLRARQREEGEPRHEWQAMSRRGKFRCDRCEMEWSAPDLTLMPPSGPCIETPRQEREREPDGTWGNPQETLNEIGRILLLCSSDRHAVREIRRVLDEAYTEPPAEQEPDVPIREARWVTRDLQSIVDRYAKTCVTSRESQLLESFNRELDRLKRYLRATPNTEEDDENE